MKTFRIITIIMGILLVVGCAPTAESPTATVEVAPTDTVAPTATAVPSPTSTPQPTATNTLTAEPSPTAAATKLPTLSEPFNLDYLVNTAQLNLLTEDIGIIEWQVEGADLEWENRLCRTFLGISWSINPNIAINCIFKVKPDVDMEKVIEWLFSQEILNETAFPLESSIAYDTEYALYGGQYNNGHAAFDGFLMGDGVLYWASISVGTPGGYTTEMVFDTYEEEIETLLYKMLMINIAQSEIADVTEDNWAGTQLTLSQNSYEAEEFEEALIHLERGIDADPEMALQIFDEQISADSQNGFIYFSRGLAQLSLDNIEDALADLSQAISLADNETIAQYYLRGFISHNQFEFENAINDWEQATSININNANVLYNLGLAYQEQGKFKAAVQSLLLVLTQDIPMDFKVEVANELVYNAEALLLLSKNQEQARLAIDAYKIVNSEIPEILIPASDFNNLCWYASLSQLAEEAMFACELAVEMEPERGGYKDSRGVARALTGDFEGAIEDFQAFIAWGLEKNVRSQEVLEQRQEWIDELETGSNPFDEALLGALRSGQ